jgi:hypothetical protein
MIKFIIMCIFDDIYTINVENYIIRAIIIFIKEAAK